ncbi:hypothetical protein Tsubulata_043631 [Turnera subulata]|uniref:Sm domain-containing protein n=1 Tax=Turnera subulata TaxID=218843 RepID=A0A9Q0G365_9ROSI|nr:hypothetical protein Tsubulata_043631 [Turnera subulata]
MKLFGWMQNKLTGKQGNSRKPNAVPATQSVKQESREEFSDWPQGLLAIGTFGNNDLKQNHEIEDVQEDQHPEEATSSPDELQDFTPEEIGKLQKELTKLLSRKPTSDNKEKEIANLPLDRFLNCPSSLEVDRRISTAVTSDVDEREEDIERTISVILGRCKDICENKKKKAIGKKSISFLLKKMFVCRSGFAPQPSLRDTLQESRMEKLLRTLLHKKINTQNAASRASSMKKYIEDKRKTNNEEIEEEKRHKTSDGSKWVKTDSECPEDVYLSTSLASYLDKKLLVLLRDGRKLMGILRSFDQFANAVLEGACERVIVGELYCDIPLGLYVIRGENVVLIGELDLEREELPPHMTRVSAAEIKRAQKAEREASDLKGTMRKRMEFLDLD